MKSIVDDSIKLAKKILISKDKGKTTFRTITLVNETPKYEDLVDHADDEKWLAANGYKCENRAGDYIFTPINFVTVIGETDNPSKVILKDVVVAGGRGPQAMEEPSEPVALISATPSNPVVTDAPEHEHTWGEWETTKPATCTEAGEEARHCTADGCSATETRAIPATGHAFADGVCTACGAAAPVEEPKSEDVPAPIEEPKGEETPTPTPAEPGSTPEPTPSTDPVPKNEPAPAPEAPVAEPAPETPAAE